MPQHLLQWPLFCWDHCKEWDDCLVPVMFMREECNFESGKWDFAVLLRESPFQHLLPYVEKLDVN